MTEFFSMPVWNWIRTGLDILAVAYIFYFVYKLFADTNSISVIKGFVVLIAIYALANLIELKTLAWLFQYLVGYFIIMVVVLFQPELRRMLSRIGQSGIAGIRSKVSIESLNEIGEAVFRMSEQKMGGLIIVERRVGLKQLMEEALPLDAGIKAELFLSIFYKGSVMHDGAVLVQGERITAARVMIPSIKLEALKHKGTHLGTRHRAGMAVTMDSDAVAVIVSEETGKVSIARDGKIETVENYEIFTRRIHEIVGME